MTLNTFSVLMSILLFTVISTLCSLFLSRTRSNHLWIIALILGLSFVRCLIPIEITGAFTINCWEIYPDLFSFVQHELFRNITVGHILCAIWLTGSCIVLLNQVIEIVRQFRLIKEKKALPAEPYIQIIAEASAKGVNCQKGIELYTVPDFVSPVMIGFIRPVILIPDQVLFFKDSEIEYILRHEISHYKGGDVWIRLLIQLLICILWWNPAVYLLRQSVIQLLELRCDDRACRTLNEEARTEYTAVLINSLKSIVNRPKSTFASSFAGNYYRSFTRQRIKVLLSPPPAKPALWKALLTASMCVFLFLGSYAVIFQPAYAPPEEPGYFLPTPENSWLIPLENGEYEVWIDGSYFMTVPPEILTSDPFNQLPIYEKENLP